MQNSVDVSPRDLVFEAIQNRAIVRATDQKLTSSNGSINTWLLDMRRILTDARLLDAVAELFWEECADRLPFQVGGMELAAVPIVSAILMMSVRRGTPINGFIVRKERKTYGTGSLIEGTLTEVPIIIVDDILNSGKSLEKVRVVLEELKRSAALAFVLVDFHRRAGEIWRTTHKIPVTAPFSASDFGLSFGKREQRPLAPIFKNSWVFSAPNPSFFHRVPKSFPATDGARVYFGSDGGYFWCLDAQNGAEIWKYKVSTTGQKNIWSAPSIHDGKVYFGGYDGNVYCLNAEDGKEIWRFTGADWVGSSPALAPELDLLFIGLEFSIEGHRGSIIALRMETGEPVWEHATRRYTHASPTYWAEEHLVACGSNDNEMFLFDALTGRMYWRFETRGEHAKGSIRHAPAFDARRRNIITGCADGCIYVVDIASGREVWSVQTGGTIYTIPLVVDDLAYIGSADKFLYVLDLERRRVKERIFAGAKIFGPPRLLCGGIYFGACNGIVYKVDPETTQVTGTHQLPDAVTNALTYSSATGMYYALTYMNQLFALEPLENGHFEIGGR